MIRSTMFATRAIAAATLAAAVLGATTLRVPTAGADPAPVRAAPATVASQPLSIEMLVAPGGTGATVIVRPTNPELISVSHSVRRLTGGGTIPPTTRIPDHVANPLSGGVLSASDAQPLPVFEPEPVYEKEARIQLTGLTSHTTYEVVVTASTRDGRTATARQTFETASKRVRLTLNTINIQDVGGLLEGDHAEPTWFWHLSGFAGGPLKDCFPKAAGQCQEGDFGEYTLLPTCSRGDRDHRTCTYTYVFAEENFRPTDNTNAAPGSEDFTSMPRQFQLRAAVHESDAPLVSSLDTFFDWGAWLGGSAQAAWQVPQGQERTSQQVTVSTDDGTFRSTMHFTFELFHDKLSYPPTDGRVHSLAK